MWQTALVAALDVAVIVGVAGLLARVHGVSLGMLAFLAVYGQFSPAPVVWPVRRGRAFREMPIVHGCEIVPWGHVRLQIHHVRSDTKRVQLFFISGPRLKVTPVRF